MLRGRRGRSVLRSLRLDDEGFVGGSGEVEMLELSERASLWNLFFFFSLLGRGFVGGCVRVMPTYDGFGGLSLFECDLARLH